MNTEYGSIYYYKVYGINIESQIRLPQLVPASCDQCDTGQMVRIMYGMASEEIQNKIKDKKQFGVTGSSIWFYAPEAGCFVISEGKTIVVQTRPAYNKQALSIYLTCSCLGFIMLQRENLVLHGSAIAMGRSAVILTGMRGAGKSTLTAALIKAGNTFLSDDVSVVRFKEQIPRVSSGFPYQKLCLDAAKRLQGSHQDWQCCREGEKPKYYIPLDHAFEEEALPVKTIVEICKEDTSSVHIQELKGREKIIHIAKNIYRGEFIPLLGGMKPGYFAQILSMAKQIRFYKLIRPLQGFTVDDQVRLVTQVM